MQLPSQNNSAGVIKTHDCPVSVILRLYDRGIAACHDRDKERVHEILTELIAALNCEYNEIAKSFYDLHKFSLRLLDDDGYEGVEDVLGGLRMAWEKVMSVTQGTSQNESSY